MKTIQSVETLSIKGVELVPDFFDTRDKGMIFRDIITGEYFAIKNNRYGAAEILALVEEEPKLPLRNPETPSLADLVPTTQPTP